MELKLVYRILRKISDWTVQGGFYSDISIEGRENVPKAKKDGHGPGLIVASTHHNELIDIATLASTIPHRRHVSFWAKSTMFANPITGAVLSSSGAIPVKRNPNSGGGGDSSNSSGKNGTGTANVNNAAPPSSSSASQIPSTPTQNGNGSAPNSLFTSTSLSLSQGQVIGVFPEGTSYTRSSIVQMMPGAAWAGVEYLRWWKSHRVKEGLGAGDVGSEGKGKGKTKEETTGLTIVPVAIVYTDKARYRSRISVKYGEPIFMDDYLEELFPPHSRDQEDNLESESERAKKVVKKIMKRVGEKLVQMSINAPDWDTICAVSTARSMLWGDENHLELSDWVDVSQRLVRTLQVPPDEKGSKVKESVIRLKAALTKYNAILHYTGIKHSILLSLLPIQPPKQNTTTNQTTQLKLTATLSLLPTLPLALLRFLLFIPPLLVHLPGYLTGPALARTLAPPREEEAQAQFKAIGGGLGVAMGSGAVVALCWQRVAELLSDNFGRVVGKSEGWRVAMGWSRGVLDSIPWVRDALMALGVFYSGVYVLVRWHGFLVDSNYRQLQTILTYYKLMTAFSSSPTSPSKSKSLSKAEEEAYCKPSLPAINIFIKRRVKNASPSASASSTDEGNFNATPDADEERNSLNPDSATRRTLIRGYLLDAREEARAALDAHLSLASVAAGAGEEEDKPANDGGPEEEEEEEEELSLFLARRGAKVPVR